MQIILIRIPIGPLLIFEEGLNPSIGSALFAKFSSISPMGFILIAQLYTLLFFLHVIYFYNFKIRDNFFG